MSAVCCVPCARRKAHKLVYENNGQIDEERGDHGRRHSVSDRNECQGKAQQRAHVGPGVNVTGFKTPTQTRLAALVQWAERRRCEALTGALRAEPRPYGKHRETRLWASGYEPAIPCRTVLMWPHDRRISAAYPTVPDTRYKPRHNYRYTSAEIN
jgi:hypothetical protein